MAAPLTSMAIRGVIWYQGESNARGTGAYEYRNLFPNMIADWREHWKRKDLPFVFVQLASYAASEGWAVVREGQLEALRVPNTGMAVAIDIGNTKDIHPKNKQEVGRRLVLAARHVAYGEDLVYSGPIYKSMEVQESKIRLRFEHIGSGLTTKDSSKPVGFTVAGKDRQFVTAEAKIEDNHVVVWSDQICNPVAVRYAWAGNPTCNLCNKEGLPASPFRTDKWPVPGQPGYEAGK